MTGTVVLDRRLLDLLDAEAQPEQIGSGCTFTEGPVWNQAGRYLVWSDIQTNTLYRWSEQDGQSVFRQPSGAANGNTYDKEGRLITCEHWGRRVSRTLADGTIEDVATHWDGKRLNSPNDVVCAPNGDTYFTDPPYGLRQADGTVLPQDLPFCGVYRVSTKDGSLSLVVQNFERPNGILVTPDGRTLYVADTQNSLIRAFDIEADGNLSGDRLFVETKHGESLGRPDGMKFDSRGNLYAAASASEGIWVYAPDATLLGFIGVPEGPANLGWGGDNWDTLYITARTSVYSLQMKVTGQPL